jgi:hypothetical protein
MEAILGEAFYDDSWVLMMRRENSYFIRSYE